jgi:DNA/RNA-binding domain of Phe-tRNA-synthetase-like protein
MNELEYIDNPIVLQKELKKLRTERRETKVKRQRNYILSEENRVAIYQKTDGKCHICGIDK